MTHTIANGRIVETTPATAPQVLPDLSALIAQAVAAALAGVQAAKPAAKGRAKHEPRIDDLSLHTSEKGNISVKITGLRANNQALYMPASWLACLLDNDQAIRAFLKANASKLAG